jgi:hypothetical protein
MANSFRCFIAEIKERYIKRETSFFLVIIFYLLGGDGVKMMALTVIVE